ncbi:MAG: class I SAM-dependent methyltransferase [Candidatus Limnocylindria bacterium]
MADPTTGEAHRIREYFGEASWRPSGGRDMLVAERRALVEQLVRATLPPLARLTVCDVGCGRGADLERWRSLGVAEDRLFGTELVKERAEAARGALPRASIATVDGFEVPFADGSFDLVTATLVVSTILDPAGRQKLLAEMRRVTRDAGMLAIYDFRVRKPWNRNVVAMSRSELAPTLGPPDSEFRLGPLLPLLDPALKLPAGLRGPTIHVLPRTHRLWVWKVGAHPHAAASAS